MPHPDPCAPAELRPLADQYPWRSWLAAALLFGCAAASAHDTWFAPQPDGAVLALGTGNRFPVQEGPMGFEFLQQQGCLQAGVLHAMQPLREVDDALLLQLPDAAGHAGPLSCWAQSQPFELTLEPDKIALYLAEVRPPPAVLAAWDTMKARGLPWRERYTKIARIERPAPDGAEGPPARPSGLGLDLLLEGPARSLRPGAEVVVRLLRDGQPLPDFNAELRFAGTAFGIWRRTDADGRLALRLPLAGQWLVRAIDLRLSDSVPDSWDSRFVTLALEVAQPPRQVGYRLPSSPTDDALR